MSSATASSTAMTAATARLVQSMLKRQKMPVKDAAHSSSTAQLSSMPFTSCQTPMRGMPTSPPRNQQTRNAAVPTKQTA